MNSDRFFRVALIISFALHGAILLQNPNLNFFHQEKHVNKADTVEVSYFKPPKEKKINREEQSLKSEPLLKLPARVVVKSVPLPPQINREDIFKKSENEISQKLNFTRPAVLKPDVIAVKKKIILSSVTPPEKNNSPSYIAHSQIVREKIKRALYQNYTKMEAGEVYLTFILSSDGILRDVRLIEEKSSPNSYLRDIALRSIRAASPFPGFPKELDYEQLTFNVIVSFQVE